MFCFVFDNRDPYVHKWAFDIIIQPSCYKKGFGFFSWTGKNKVSLYPFIKVIVVLFYNGHIVPEKWVQRATQV